MMPPAVVEASDFAFPSLRDLPDRPRRVVWHWTAGALFATKRERLSYHVLVERLEGHPADPGDDRVIFRAGVPIERNMRAVDGPSAVTDPEGGYAAHVALLNSYSIGVAVCGMRGAVDYRPDGLGVRPGPSPITALQIRALLAISAAIARVYELDVSERTFLGHYEVERVFGVRLTPGRWDVSWIPGVDVPRAATGAWLRDQLARWLAETPIDDRLYAPPEGDSSNDATTGEEG